MTTSRKRIAIVGFAETTNKLTPYDDPSWCIVTMNEYYRYAKRSDLHIEIHQEQDYLPESVPGYLEWLKSCPIPIFMQRHSKDIPMSVRYPIEKIIDRWGVDYFTCTVAFEIAWAIEQEPDEIGLWGVDLAVGGEYFFERPCAEFWLGVCKGLGIRVTIPKGAALLRQSYRYGYEHEPDLGAIKISDIKARMARHEFDKAKAHAQYQAVDGAIQEDAYWLTFLETRAHGSGVPGSTG